MITQIIDFILHIDVHLAQLTTDYGMAIYVILFLIVFCETGLVIMPFLPGDSLLFAAGALAAIGNLNIWALLIIFIVAAFLGDTVNYWIGNYIGPKAFSMNNRFLKKEYLEKAKAFFDKHGVKSIVLARFVPIVRTFAPFIAGIGQMDYKTFVIYNFVGGVVWVGIFTLAGFFFGNVPIVKHNFELVIILILVISAVPILWEFVMAKVKKEKE
jgi:membrane-associated protein